MNAADTDRLEAIKQELNSILEARIGDLLGHVRATQEVTRQILSTEEEIRRQEAMRAQLEGELEPLEGENRKLQERVEQLQANVDRMRKLKQELMSNLSSLKGELND